MTTAGDSHFEAGILLGWWALYRAAIRKSQYSPFAEDVASSMTIKLLRMRGGRGPATCPKALPRVYRLDALRVARRESRGSATTGLDWGAVAANDPGEDDEASCPNPMTSLGRIFTTTEIEVLIGRCREGWPRWKDLAAAIGVSERTLRSRVREVRALRRD